MTNTRVLTFIDYYLPGFMSGGPVRTISNLVDHLGGEFLFLIVTRDRDINDVSPYPNVNINSWNKVGDAQVLYLQQNSFSFKKILRIMRETDHDIVYLNSFFSPRTTILPCLCMLLGLVPRKPLIIAPRGQFAVNALSLKQQKKRLFLWVSRLIGLYHRAIWQVSSEHEATDVRREMKNQAKDIRIVPNLPRYFNASPPVAVEQAPSDHLRIVFLSRISQMKNLDFAIRVLSEVNARVLFDIYGPAEDATYWRQCQLLLKQLPENITVAYQGSVESDLVGSVLRQYDLLFLPTRGENFGHVIVESLSVGTPVLISDKTPWRNLCADRLGWDLPLDDAKKFAVIIEDCSLEDAAVRHERRIETKQKILDRLSIPQNVEANRKLFNLSGNP